MGYFPQGYQVWCYRNVKIGTPGETLKNKSDYVQCRAEFHICFLLANFISDKVLLDTDMSLPFTT